MVNKDLNQLSDRGKMNDFEKEQISKANDEMGFDHYVDKFSFEEVSLHLS